MPGKLVREEFRYLEDGTSDYSPIGKHPLSVQTWQLLSKVFQVMVFRFTGVSLTGDSGGSFMASVCSYTSS